MNEQEEFFFRTAISAALELPHRDCIQFLQGMLFFGGEHIASPGLRKIVQGLTECDAQLELLASGQLKFEELLKP